VPEDGHAVIIDHVWGLSEATALLRIGCGEAAFLPPDDAGAAPFLDLARRMIDQAVGSLEAAGEAGPSD
jgi:hypothetical protein